MFKYSDYLCFVRIETGFWYKVGLMSQFVEAK